MQKQYSEKIKGLFSNEAFVKKFEELDNVEKIAELFKEFGVELTDEEIADFVNSAIEAKKNEELDDEELENINGGAIGFGAVAATWAFAVDYWGGTREACVATYSFWRNVFR